MNQEQGRQCCDDKQSPHQYSFSVVDLCSVSLPLSNRRGGPSDIHTISSDDYRMFASVFPVISTSYPVSEFIPNQHSPVRQDHICINHYPKQHHPDQPNHHLPRQRLTRKYSSKEVRKGVPSTTSPRSPKAASASAFLIADLIFSSSLSGSAPG